MRSSLSIRHWPVLLVEVQPSEDSEESFDEHYGQVRAALDASEGPIAVLFDARSIDGDYLDGERRRRASAGFARIKTHLARVRAQAYVVADRRSEGRIRGYLWASHHPYPVEVFQAPEAALAWLGIKIVLPPALSSALLEHFD